MTEETRRGTLRDQWQAMPPWQRRGTLALAAVELVATTVAVADLIRRPKAQVRGPKALWWPALSIQPLGPFAYLLLGRRRR